MKNELGGKIMTEFPGVPSKTYSYLINHGSGDKKARGIKIYLIERILSFNDYKNCLLNKKSLISMLQYLIDQVRLECMTILYYLLFYFHLQHYQN